MQHNENQHLNNLPTVTDTVVPSIQPEVEAYAPVTIRKSTRPNKTPHRVDFHCNAISATIDINSQVLYPLSSVLSYSKISQSHLHYTLSISASDEPQDIKMPLKMIIGSRL